MEVLQCLGAVSVSKEDCDGSTPMTTCWTLTARSLGLVYWGLTPQPGSYQGSEMMMMKSVLESRFLKF